MENLGIDVKLLIAQLINFILFFYIFKRFIAVPFMKFIVQEKNNDKEKEKILLEIKTQKDNFDEEDKIRRLKIKQEMDYAGKQARKEAEKVKKGVINEANKEAEVIINRVKKQLEEEKNLMHREMKNKTGELSVLLINKALNNYLNEEAQKKVTQYILNNLVKDIQYN